MLKPYIGYSCYCGSHESAILIFATNAREAKKIGWHEANGTITDEYIEFAVRLLRDKPWIMDYADTTKLAAKTPHVVFEVPCCKDCEIWGYSPLINGLCKGCREDREDAEDFRRAWDDAGHIDR